MEYSKESVKVIVEFIEKETGILFHENSYYQLKNRLDNILGLEQIDIDTLVRKIQNNMMSSSLRQRVVDGATNNETLFFRDPVFFKAIENMILDFASKNPSKEIKIWSAASSTGQEAVSLMISICELAQKHSLPKISIMATDISTQALEKAKNGIYTDFEVSRGLSDERKAKYFTKQGNGWKVKDEILSKIKYFENNLVKPSLFDKFDLIMCRNVLIYQTVALKQTVVNYLVDNLNENGFLVLGVGETLLGIKNNLESQNMEKVVFYKKPSLNNIKKAA